VRNALALHWPSLLVGSACAGLALSNRVQVGTTAAAAAALACLVAVSVLAGGARVVALGAALAVVGLGWGTLRLDALERSLLVEEVGSSGTAELVVTAPPRQTSWAVRVPAEVRRFRGERLRERVLLVLPVGRSPPRGAVVEAVVRVREPREPQPGDAFDERV
jgi:hypothetical protein